MQMLTAPRRPLKLGRGSMTDYSVYFLDHLARIEFGVDLRCSDDAAAFEFARGLLPETGRAELWCGARRLGQRWLGKSGHAAKWSFCLKAASMAAEQEMR